MHRFFLPPDRIASGECVLDHAEAHHAIRVLRLRPGDEVQVLDGLGGIYECQLQSVSKQAVWLSIVKQRKIDLLPWQITLGQALPKRKAMDLIIQKATELGVGQLIPLETDRTEVRLMHSARQTAKDEKWQAIAIESLKQCGSPWLPKIQPVQMLTDFLSGSAAYELKLVGSLAPNSTHPRRHFQNHRARHFQPPKDIALLIGPEGDFTQSELDHIQTAGFVPVSFGRAILRSDTAVVYGLSILNYELQAWHEDWADPGPGCSLPVWNP